MVVEKVSDLLLAEGGGWDVYKLKETFFEADVSNILKIPVGRAGTDDYLAWNYTKNGIFSVRSAYHLKNHIKQADVPSKVNVHFWRLAKKMSWPLVRNLADA